VLPGHARNHIFNRPNMDVEFNCEVLIGSPLRCLSAEILDSRLVKFGSAILRSCRDVSGFLHLGRPIDVKV